MEQCQYGVDLELVPLWGQDTGNALVQKRSQFKTR
jgi:hypothetical protein